MADTAKLTKALARFDAALTEQPGEARRMLAPAAKRSAIGYAEEKLGKALPASLRGLYLWHDGDKTDVSLFDALLNEHFEEKWSAYSDVSCEVRFMPLEEVRRATAFEAYLDAKGTSCAREEGGENTVECQLVPFLWIRRSRDELEDDEEDDGWPDDHDWYLAVDTVGEAVWLFEIANEGLEGAFKEAPSLAAFMDGLAKKLEAGPILDMEAMDPAAPKAPPVELGPRAPAILLLKLMVEKQLVELAEGVKLEDVAVKLAPVLAFPVERAAVKGAVEFFESDEGIAEIFADDDVLRKLIKEFVG